MIHALIGFTFRQAPIEIREGLVIGGVAAPGRVPVVQDAIVAKLVRGEPVLPTAGDSLTTPRGSTVLWKGAKAGSGGRFESPELGGSGYLFTSVDMPDDRTMILEASGHNLVYVNGVPRAGDPYGYGYLRLPVRLHKGANSLLFSVGRGWMRARLVPTTGPYRLETADLTLPDVIPSDTGNLMGGVVVMNASPSDATDLSISCSSAGKTVTTKLPRIPALSVRKVRFDFPASAKDLDLMLTKNGVPFHSAMVGIRRRTAGQTYKRTFISAIDGSVQYYAVNPSTKPDPSNALILSLHGASVEAIGQADAYSPKAWATLVAPTNRRPYGFDWEEWGRMDAMEVLGVAGARIPHDPKRVVVTGHSMGGHGTWSVGSLYPSRFGAVAPSAGWVSFWSYGGGWEPREATLPEAMLRRAMSPSDTLARITNLAAQKVYVLHGDADDNVPVGQARTMKRALANLGIEFGYHEEPGAGHWWGSQCVDYPELMATLEAARISDFATVDFTTPDPAVSANCGWITVLQQISPRMVSRVRGDTGGLTTENVRSIRFEQALPSLTLDGQKFSNLSAKAVLVKTGSNWAAGQVPATARHLGFSGPLKQAFRDRFVLVYGTSGSAEENEWSRNKARFEAESFYYRGNGSPEVVSDAEFLKGDYAGRNAAVYGNSTTNLAWAALLGKSPIRLGRGALNVGEKKISADGSAVAFLYPSERRLVAAIGGADLAGMRLTDRLPVFGSGTAFPDWMVLSPEAAEKGTKGILAAGFFGPDWGLASGEAAWRE
ncbi:prolyl oligopeptidase family serine peptidase [Fimbriimonas ginsengisoli]|uniref:Putative esterase n=1 Tax=Fimbriimonas ginsengisoli Gsoil 348 TaxID=661478 RepID=A0A068NPH0_FIMGI|nr:prolyl oligopeptidase family serine peptidase [Fimbriimonas ginsengisoli]AIE85346.1 putative esterase [Fimbriimonas ginsengisoli Gsoil 348]